MAREKQKLSTISPKQSNFNSDFLVSEFEYEQRENPLLNVLVLDEIFRNLNLRELKACRQVCKLWDEVSMPSLRRRSKIHISNEQAFDTKINGKTSHLHKLGNYELGDKSDPSKILTRFLEFPNPLPLREVKLNCILISNEMITFLSKFPLLESITFCVSVVSYAHSSSGNLTLEDVESIQGKKLNNVHFPRLRRIVCLSIPLTETKIFFNFLLSAPNLCEIVTCDPMVNLFILTKLSVWSMTLKKLELGFVTRESVGYSKDSFPLLNQLKRLTARGGNFEFPDPTKVPSLEDVVFEFVILDKLFPPYLESTPMTSLRIEKPYIKNWSGFTSERFPFLKKLDFPEITNKLFRAVCQNIKTLEEFHAGKAIQDYSVTGIPRYRAKKWIEVVEAAKLPNFGITKYRKHPSVSDLPKLVLLKIMSKKLTEASILLGVIYCRSLTFLEVELVETSKISEALIDAISSKLPNLRKLLLRVDKLKYEEVLDARIRFKNKIPNCIIRVHNSYTYLFKKSADDKL